MILLRHAGLWKLVISQRCLDGKNDFGFSKLWRSKKKKKVDASVMLASKYDGVFVCCVACFGCTRGACQPPNYTMLWTYHFFSVCLFVVVVAFEFFSVLMRRHGEECSDWDCCQPGEPLCRRWCHTANSLGWVRALAIITALATR